MFGGGLSCWLRESGAVEIWNASGAERGRREPKQDDGAGAVEVVYSSLGGLTYEHCGGFLCTTRSNEVGSGRGDAKVGMAVRAGATRNDGLEYVALEKLRQ